MVKRINKRSTQMMLVSTGYTYALITHCPDVTGFSRQLLCGVSVGNGTVNVSVTIFCGSLLILLCTFLLFYFNKLFHFSQITSLDLLLFDVLCLQHDLLMLVLPCCSTQLFNTQFAVGLIWAFMLCKPIVKHWYFQPIVLKFAWVIHDENKSSAQRYLKRHKIQSYMWFRFCLWQT